MVKKGLQPDPDKILKRLAGQCARSEQCRSDIVAKLYRARLTATQRDEILNYLVENRYVDDGRYARAFTNDKVRFSCWGRRKIRMALAAKRISPTLITEAFETIDPAEYEASLARATRSLAKDVDFADREAVSKLYRRLLARGYESNLISKALKDYQGAD